jgi:hypothetical protein
MHPYEQYWLVNYVATKYGDSPQVIKETNLFFATKALLDLFPDSKAIILAREAAGIASSFASGDLFRRWNYAERYNQLKAMTKEPRFAEYDFIFNGEHDPGSLRKLTRLVVLNALLVSTALNGRDKLIVRYEDSVTDRSITLKRLGQFLIAEGVSMPTEEESHAFQGGSDHDFNTRKHKTRLGVDLDKDDLHTVRMEVRRLLADSLTVLSASQYEDVQYLLESSHSYEADGRKIPKATALEPKEIVKPAPEYVRDGENEWLNQPVSNTEFAQFLNKMYQEGVPNTIHGTQLFVNENMIPERGGRIWFNSNQGKYDITPGYENSPVYWVTWLGAATYARYHGCRLPQRQEIDALTRKHIDTINPKQINVGHNVGDASPAGQFPANSQAMYDLIGNVASWCQDGTASTVNPRMSRYMYGSSWNGDATAEAYTHSRERPISGCSRSTGIRLIKDENSMLTPAELAERFDGWFTLLGTNLAPARADRYIIDQLIR